MRATLPMRAAATKVHGAGASRIMLHVAQSQYHDIGIAKKLGIAACWIERRHGMKDSGGTIESEHTVPDYHFRTLAELADAVDAGR